MEYDHREHDGQYLSRYELSMELLKSIREIDCRIDELKMVLGDGPCSGQPERRQKLVDRVQRLIETRFCLVYSFLDVNPNIKKDVESLNPFDHFHIDYDMLKRQVATDRR